MDAGFCVSSLSCLRAVVPIAVSENPAFRPDRRVYGCAARCELHDLGAVPNLAQMRLSSLDSRERTVPELEGTSLERHRGCVVHALEPLGGIGMAEGFRTHLSRLPAGARRNVIQQLPRVGQQRLPTGRHRGKEQLAHRPVRSAEIVGQYLMQLRPESNDARRAARLEPAPLDLPEDYDPALQLNVVISSPYTSHSRRQSREMCRSMDRRRAYRHPVPRRCARPTAAAPHHAARATVPNGAFLPASP